MGGDRPPQAIFEAVIEVSSGLKPGQEIVAFVEHSFYPELDRVVSEQNLPVTFVTTEETITPEESPLFAVRRKKKSSMAAGMKLLKEEEIDAFVSTGNTGALVATSRLYLSCLPGVDRPALLVMMPTEKGRVAVLDVGANLLPKPAHLLTYAKLGSYYRTAVEGIAEPTVGLLNIGTEEQKGPKEIKETFHLLENHFGDRFLGNIEGKDVFKGKIDVLITDGFTGNVFLKTAEGISQFLLDFLREKDPNLPLLTQLHAQFDYSEHPGALLIGLDHLVIKCHGHSDKRALLNGIMGAFTLAKNSPLPTIRSSL